MTREILLLCTVLFFTNTLSLQDESLSSCLQHFKTSVQDPKGFLKSWTFNSTTRNTTDICRDFKQVLSCNITTRTFMLSLSNMSLQGTFASLEHCTHLTTINLNVNNFTGVVNESLCSKFPNLVSLSMSSNQLTGGLPDLGACSRLSLLDLTDNRLTGLLPENICVKNTSIGINLLLSKNQLTGRFPSGIDSCNGSFNFSHNRLTGEIPKGLRMQKIKTLDISNNNLSGILYSYMQQFGEPNFAGNPQLLFQAAPSCLAEFKQSVQHPVNFLVNWNKSTELCEYEGVTCSREYAEQPVYYTFSLANARLIGEFPSCLEDWYGLKNLDLSRNQLTGSVPEFNILITKGILKTVDISYNKLTGSVPNTFKQLALSYTSHNYFNNTDRRGSHKQRTLFIIVLLSLTLMAGIMGLLLFWRRKSTARSTDGSDTEYYPPFKLLEHLQLKRQDFLKVTQNFDAKWIIGRGGTSTVYIGFLPDGQPVAVKRLELEKENMEHSRKMFLRELHTVGKLRHRNLVKVLGYYSSLDFMAVILEYMPYGSLEQLLHPRVNSYPLEWSYRHKFAVEIAQGLNYLHHDSGQPLSHNDLKPSNILLDEDFRARIADFGLAKILNEAAVNTFTFSWTIGYAAPEVAQGARPSIKADVYSFGIILMEFVTGRRPCDERFENVSMRDYIKRALQKGELWWQDVLDKELYADVELIHEMLEVVDIALICTHRVAASRPDMKSVLFRLVECKFKTRPSDRALRL